MVYKFQFFPLCIVWRIGGGVTMGCLDHDGQSYTRFLEICFDHTITILLMGDPIVLNPDE
jgi:hypothetical protein